MNREEKTLARERLRTKFAEPGVVVAVCYSGLNVAQMSDLRRKMKQAGGSLSVIKNRLARAALDGRGGQAAQDMFVGPIALACSADAVAAPKIVCDFANDNEKLVIIGALMDDDVLDPSAVAILASMPSLDELRGTIAGLIKEPARRVATLVSVPVASLARLVRLREQQQGQAD